MSPVLLLLACAGPPPDAAPPEDRPRWSLAGTDGHGLPGRRLDPPPGNLLVVIIDDLGTDKLGLYGLHPEVPATPTLDALATAGVTFDRAYANPKCSPSRALLLTGRRAWRTGIGMALGADGYLQLEEDEHTLAELLPEREAHFIGKWHLSSIPNDMATHPNRQGFAHYSGMLTGFAGTAAYDGREQGWDDWEKTVDGEVFRTTAYQTTDTTDDAVASVEALPEPWVLVVSYYAPHSPYHFPPPGLTPSPVVTGTTPPAQKFNRMVESVDTELARVLDAVDATATLGTTVVVLGDNGTPEEVMEPELPHGKLSVYEGGTRVPLIVAGHTVAGPGRRSSELVELTDVVPTLLELSHGAPAPRRLDGVSFAPVLRDPRGTGVRRAALSESFQTLGDDGSGERAYELGKLAVRDATHRLVWSAGVEELYRLDDDFVEGEDLLLAPLSDEDQAAYDALWAEVPAYWTDRGI